MMLVMNILLLVGVNSFKFGFNRLNNVNKSPLFELNSLLEVPTTISNYQSYCTTSFKLTAVKDSNNIDNNSTPLLTKKTGSKRRKVLNFLKNIIPQPFKNTQSLGKLILVRSGESRWNYEGKFTGWTDVGLTTNGTRDLEFTGNLLREYGYKVDIAYTSQMKRAIDSTHILLRELKQVYRPVIVSYKLNGRMYGGLEGLSKIELEKAIGFEAMEEIRTNLDWRPPALGDDHPHMHRQERKFLDIPDEEMPLTESLRDTMNRASVIWESDIWPDLKAGKNVLVVGHSDSLKGIIQQIDDLSSQELQELLVPNCLPLMYQFDADLYKSTGEIHILQPKLDPHHHHHSPTATTTTTTTTGGLNTTTSTTTSSSSSSFRGTFLQSRSFPELFLNAQKNRKSHHFPDENAYHEHLLASQAQSHLQQLAKANMNNNDDKNIGTSIKTEIDYQTAILNQFIQNYTMNYKPSSKNSPIIRRQYEKPTFDTNLPFVVITRHGKTEFNKLGLFTGWEDAMLTKEGRTEAKRSGQLLRHHGIEFDIVYTSWLTRAIETSWHILEEMDALWLPIVKTWRLNERMYGALTGLSKKMVGQQYGDEKLTKWRHGYDTPPPPLTSFSPYYPGNDERYVKYVKDIPISLFETVIRSIANGKFELHYNLPKTESLKDSMDRTIPYFKNIIYPESIAKGKRVLIASSENAIRGLLMHLCDIPADQISEVEIPTGLPMVFDFNLRCIKLLDDGLYKDNDPLKRYYFGKKPELIFKPCDDSDDQCYFSDDYGRSFKNDPLIRLPVMMMNNKNENEHKKTMMMNNDANNSSNNNANSNNHSHSKDHTNGGVTTSHRNTNSESYQLAAAAVASDILSSTIPTAIPTTTTITNNNNN